MPAGATLVKEGRVPAPRADREMEAAPKNLQNAAWVLLSSDFFSAAECKEMGLAWKVCEPDDLMPTVMTYAKKLAAQAISSLKTSQESRARVEGTAGVGWRQVGGV